MLVILVFFVAFIDGMMDGLDHGKGAADLKHIWHLLKTINRLLLIVVGWQFCFFITYGLIFFDWFEWSFSIGMLVLSLVAGKTCWYYFRYTYVERLIYFDDHVDLSFGQDKIDEFLGFDKEITEPIFRWPWRKK
jgi:hypothetical protein